MRKTLHRERERERELHVCVCARARIRAYPHSLLYYSTLNTNVPVTLSSSIETQ